MDSSFPRCICLRVTQRSICHKLLRLFLVILRRVSVIHAVKGYELTGVHLRNRDYDQKAGGDRAHCENKLVNETVQFECSIEEYSKFLKFGTCLSPLGQLDFLLLHSS